MLFYYFKTKQDLYYYLVDYSLDFIKERYLNVIDIDEPDFIKRLVKATKLKMEVFTKHPDIFRFLGTLFINDDIKLPAELENKYTKFQQLGYAIMYENIDKTLFREDVDVDKAFQLIQWSIDGYQNNLLQQLKGKKLSDINFDPYWDEFFGYLAVLKTAFYKNEEGEE